MPALKKYQHDKKEGFSHPVTCPQCSNSSLMDNGQHAGVETSVCPHCGYKFRNVGSKFMR